MREHLGKLIHPFLALIACATDTQLTHYIEYLKAENRILRARLPKKLDTTEAELATLLKLGRRLGPMIKELISIVTPRTFLRWVQDEQERERKATGRSSEKNEKTKGNKTPPEVRELILRMAKEDQSGAGRFSPIFRCRARFSRNGLFGGCLNG